MGKFERVRDVIEFSKSFHHQVGDLYEKLSTSADNERIKMFLEYLSRHEKNIEIHLHEFESGLSDNLLDSWFSFLPEDDKIKCIDKIEIDSVHSVDDVTDLALELDNCLLQIYKRIAAITENHKIKDIFQNLYEMGNEDIHKLVLSAQRLKSL